MNIICLFCTLCVFIGLTSLIQICSGIYFAIIRDDTAAINHLVKIDQFDSYLLYIILVCTGLGLISLLLSFCSIYSTVRRLNTLSLFVTTLWVSLFKNKYSFVSICIQIFAVFVSYRYL